MNTSSTVWGILGVLVIVAIIIVAIIVPRNNRANDVIDGADQGTEQTDGTTTGTPNTTNGSTGSNTAIPGALTKVQAEHAATSAWKINYNPAEGERPVTTLTSLGNNTYRVVVTFPVMDDSVKTSRYEGTATYVNGSWTLTSPADITWSCQAGRGHQDFSTVACL